MSLVSNHFLKICFSDRNICISGNDLMNGTKNAIPVQLIDISEFENWENIDDNQICI